MKFYIVLAQAGENDPTIDSSLVDTVTPHYATPTLSRVSAGYYQIDNGGYYDWSTAKQVACSIKNVPAAIGNIAIYQESGNAIALRSYGVDGLSVDINGTVEVYIDITDTIEVYDDADTGTSNTGLTESQLFTVTADKTAIFSDFNDKFEINSYGYFGADANTKRLRGYVNVGTGNELILDTTALAITTLTYWHIRILAVRVNSTSLWVFAEFFSGSTILPTYVLRTLITDADLDNTSPVFSITGETTTSGKIVTECSYSLKIPQAITDYS